MSQEERIAFAFAEMQREIASLQEQVQRLERQVQAMVDIWRACACFGSDS